MAEADVPADSGQQQNSAAPARRRQTARAARSTNTGARTPRRRASIPETEAPRETPQAARRAAPATPAKTSAPPRRRPARAAGAQAAAASPATPVPVPAAPIRPAPAVPPRPRRDGGITPENTVFVSLCFEGPDVYSTAGGLGTRVTELTETLAAEGYETHLIFVGDPTKPGVEVVGNGRLHLKRWGQWISAHYPNGVYEGEEQKLYDYNESVPYHVYEEIVVPAVAQNKLVVVIGEDWHTAETLCHLSDVLNWHNVRQRCILMWNCNSLMSLHRINWGRLNFCSTITTVSKYMKHRLWQYQVNPLVIPNGIPPRFLDAVDAGQAAELQRIMQRGDPERFFLFKIGRFDPDKRWLMAIEAAARLKYSGHPLSFVIRGGIEPHGAEALNRARYLGLRVHDIEAHRPTIEDCLRLMREAPDADVYNLRYFVPTDFVRLCYAAADATLANSGHEPFGLVGLEVMAAGGVAFVGSTGEDYAVSFENCVSLDTDDPDEIVGYLLHLSS
ncbi:MAG TPA: glycosyltransferase, partial [Ktedonobacterales bacterium]|nr:glycosyltransferase [Ktedonobacterales bacterium]